VVGTKYTNTNTVYLPPIRTISLYDRESLGFSELLEGLCWAKINGRANDSQVGLGTRDISLSTSPAPAISAGSLKCLARLSLDELLYSPLCYLPERFYLESSDLDVISKAVTLAKPQMT